MVKHYGNKSWCVDYGKTTLLWNLNYHGTWFYHVTNHHGRNTLVNLVP